MPELKDIAVAVLGADVGLAAVLVVFLGFLVAHAEGFPAGTPIQTKKRYLVAAKWGLAPTGAAIVDALVCYGWMFRHEPWLLCMWSIGFPVVALAFLAYAVIVIVILTWR